MEEKLLVKKREKLRDLVNNIDWCFKGSSFADDKNNNMRLYAQQCLKFYQVFQFS